jgi:hypothetical protein
MSMLLQRVIRKGGMTRQPWRVCTATFMCLAVLVVGVYFWTHHRGIRYAGFGWIPATSFAEMRKSPPFVAVVESKMRGVWGPVVDSSTGKPAVGATPTTYVIIYLRKADGKRLAVCQENPTPDEVTLVSHLSEGEKYTFPTGERVKLEVGRQAR